MERLNELLMDIGRPARMAADHLRQLQQSQNAMQQSFSKVLIEIEHWIELFTM